MADYINKAYRTADGLTHQTTPLILGYEIKLSATAKPKTRCELCRTLAGAYPVWFKWSAWHDECICFKIPILMSDDMMAKYQKLVARGEDTPEAIKALQMDLRIESLPLHFIKWCRETVKDPQDFEKAPDFIKENFNDFKHLQLYINN